MPRRKISEYKAKTLFQGALNLPYTGWPVDNTKPLTARLKEIPPGSGPFVVKVDQGIKGRYKKGLLALHVAHADLRQTVTALSKKGYDHFIVEPMLSYGSDAERYLSLNLTRGGLSLRHTAKGGVDVEANTDSVKEVLLDNREVNWHELSRGTAMPAGMLRQLIDEFRRSYAVFLEINPYVAVGKTVHFVDMAVEVDDAGAYFVDSWSEDDFIGAAGGKTDEERAVEALNAKSPASFKLNVLDPDGGVFLLLSGGGASIAIADEVKAQAAGHLLANYGEYSGNPNSEETYIYTRAVLSVLLRSKAPKKVLFIGGAVANFTDIATTFTGVSKAIAEKASELAAHGVKVYVRRGGPRQEIGLPRMERQLAGLGLLGAVHGPEVTLADAVQEMVEVMR